MVKAGWQGRRKSRRDVGKGRGKAGKLEERAWWTLFWIFFWGFPSLCCPWVCYIDFLVQFMDATSVTKCGAPLTSPRDGLQEP